MAKNRRKMKPRSALPSLLTAALFLLLLYMLVFLRSPQPTEAPEPDAAPAAETAEPTPEPTPDDPAELRLSEIMVKNHTAWRAPDGSFPDWVELFNADSEPVDLEGWRLADIDRGGWALPARTLQPGEYLVVCADGSGRVGDDLLCADFSLSPGETVFLRSPDGTLVDQLRSEVETANHSLARGEDGELFETKDPTPGLPNTRQSAAAYAASLAPSGPLSINEVVVSNLSTLAQGGRYYDWVELKNVSEEPVRLSDYYLSDDEDEPLLWQLPDRTLAPGRTFVVFCSGDESLTNGGNLHTNFALNAEEEDLFLSDADGRAVDFVYLRNVPAGGSVGRLPEHPGWVAFLTATPRAENGPVRIFIDKTCLLPGEPLRVYNPLGYELRFSRGGEPLSEGAFTPSEADYETWIDVEAYEDGRLVSADRAYFSRLPVLYIDTKNAVPVKTRSVYLPGTLTIQNNAVTDSFVYSGGVSIRGRGNMSWNWPKKPYRIKLGSKADLFGMGENKNWVLLANYLDESFLRSATAARLSAQLGMPVTENVWTELVLNGEYLGCYQLIEQVRLGESRVDIFDWEAEAERAAEAICAAERAKGVVLDQDALEDTLKGDLRWITGSPVSFGHQRITVSDYYPVRADITGGYLFELTKEYDEPTKFTLDSGLRVMVRTPEALYTNREMTNYVKALWAAFDAAYRTENGYAATADGARHYTEMADLDSMVDYWLINELLGNQDAYKKSRFAYKDTGDLLRFGPVWDFDWGGGSLKTPFKTGGGWVLARQSDLYSFFREWLDDPLFVVRATERYWTLRPYFDTLLGEGGVLENEIALLRVSGLADGRRWDRRVTFGDLARGFELDAETYLRYLRERIAWMDEKFASDAELLASVRTDKSACPYTKDDAALGLSLVGAQPDTVSAHAPADGLLPAGEALTVEAAVAGDAASVEFYCNGLYLGAAEPQNGIARFTVEAGRLNEGRKTVISLIAKDAVGATLCRNYASVLTAG